MADRPTDGDRGQSELLGFLLIFAVVVLTIALVSATGFVGFNSAQDYQRTTNAEQAFTVLANNVDDVVRAGAPSRVTEIRIADASLSLAEETTNVTIDDGNGTETVALRMEPIVYDSGTDTTITYRSGALVRQDGESSVMLREPNFVITDEEVVLPLVQTSLEDSGKVGGTTDVDVRTRGAGTEIVAEDESVTSVSLELTTPHADAWRRYFEQFEDGGEGPVTNVEETETGVEVTIEAERLYVTVDRVAVSFR